MKDSRRRGETARKDLPTEGEHEYPKWIQTLADDLVRVSELEDHLARPLAEDVALIQRVLWDYKEVVSAGKRLLSDEARTIPGMVAKKQKLMEALKVIKPPPRPGPSERSVPDPFGDEED